MLKKLTAATVSLALVSLPTATLAGSPTGGVRKWDPTDVRGKVRAQRYTTPDGRKVLVDKDEPQAPDRPRPGGLTGSDRDHETSRGRGQCGFG